MTVNIRMLVAAIVVGMCLSIPAWADADDLGLGRLVIPIGIVTFALLAATVITGLSIRRRPRLYNWHKGFAVATILSAAAHGLLVFFGR